MKHIHIVVGGTYFLEEKVKFFDNPVFHAASNLSLEHVNWEQVNDKSNINVIGDAVFIFGIKHWVRKLRKRRLSTGQIRDRIMDFIIHNFGTKIPIGILDDLDTKLSKEVGNALCKDFMKRCNCNLVLLREYLRDNSYDKRFHPFAMCSVDRTELMKHMRAKKVDFYFRGDDSSKERREIVGKMKSMNIHTDMKVYKGGSRSSAKLPPGRFFEKMSASKICLNVKGNGYSCYRYQEIPSVGSILATPEYPLVTNNDYEDMTSCIRFKNPKELQRKIKEALSSTDLIASITNNGLDVFKRFHTTDVRFSEFMNFLEEL
tara:strand:+ start:221 stop:1171 length:951 start_codon:yes stop_codon:yes gene_type:complete